MLVKCKYLDKHVVAMLIPTFIGCTAAAVLLLYAFSAVLKHLHRR